MLGLSLSVPYNHITGDPSLITGLIGWWDFTKIETMTQNVDRSSPVTADGQYIGTINNLATGTEVGLATQTVGAGKLGEFLRARTDTGTAANWKPVYKTDGVNGYSYASFPNSGEVALSAGIFGNLDAGENNASWGGSNGAGAFSNLSFFGKEQTIIIVEQIGTANITGPNAMYQVRGGCNDCPTSGDDRKVVINTQKVADETYNTFMGNNASGAASEVTATSSAFANTNIRCIVTSTTSAGGSSSPANGQAMIYANGTLEDTENLDELSSTPAANVYYGFDMSMTQAPTSSGASFAQVSIGAEVNDQYLSASSFGLNHYYGKIYEVIHFAKTLSEEELAMIEQYISIKYSITFS